MKVHLHNRQTGEIKVWPGQGVERGTVQSTGEPYVHPWELTPIEMAADLLPALVQMIEDAKAKGRDLNLAAYEMDSDGG